MEALIFYVKRAVILSGFTPNSGRAGVGGFRSFSLSRLRREDTPTLLPKTVYGFQKNSSRSRI